MDHAREDKGRFGTCRRCCREGAGEEINVTVRVGHEEFSPGDLLCDDCQRDAILINEEGKPS